MGIQNDVADSLENADALVNLDRYNASDANRRGRHSLVGKSRAGPRAINC